MLQLTDEQLNNLNKEALVIIASSLQSQLVFMQEQLNTANAQLADTNRQIELLTEQIRIMNQRQFGKKSEASSEIEGQMSLFDSFNEVEATANPSAPEPEITEIIISSYKRSKTKGKRDVDLDGLPARIIEHKLSEEELAEKFPNGYKELPEEIYKRLQIIPETFIVDEHHVHVYASKDNDGTIVKAPRSVDLFRNSIATPSLVASLINGKYVNALPIERQKRAFKDNGINLETNTMCNWIINATERYLSLVYDRMHELIYDSKVIHADETPVKVMQIDKTKIKNGKKTYMWVYRNNPHCSEHPIVLYDWKPSRKADHPREFLKDFSGTVVTDGYQVYHKLGKKRHDLQIAGCWIHARRPFAEFIKSVGTETAKGSIAEEAYAMITEIMHIDNSYDDLTNRDRKKQRQLVLKEKVDAYFEWAKSKYSQVTHKSVTGRALAYSLNQEEYLRAFLNDGKIPMDNNYAEQAIRPFTIARKNFVLIESSNGANASAMIFSLAETAKANGLNTYQYFELLLSEIPKHMEDNNLNFLNDLMPWSKSVQQKCPSKYKKS
ncbi:Transposase [Pseudobutyrivibrio sp. YE44]|uniref:IS66 family transposase n=1 Tax=Pseudobutyrivibrio sp. YE44 TaxID=1520802 RepID=UPI00088E8274|nr:IS66 family transposase [Pseudobutyrivibrio sp. YE44]SDB57574.1 Transposase [Pseudobutyrivibrio sp. YE44]